MWTIFIQIFITIAMMRMDIYTVSISSDDTLQIKAEAQSTVLAITSFNKRLKTADHVQVFVESTSKETCAKCKCYSALLSNKTEVIFVDCKSTNMTDIPLLPAITTALDLSYNKIVDLDKIANKTYTDLIYLSLANNGIYNLTGDCFKLFPNLKMLDLSANKIRYNNIHVNAFKSVNQLLFLDIKQEFPDNDITANESFPDKALSSLTKLQTLAVDGVDQKGPGIGFSNLIHLRELYLSGDYGRCNIPVLDKSFFQFIRPAQNFSLYLSVCYIKSIGYETFKALTNLTALDISFNMDLKFNSVVNLTHGMNRTNIKFLNVNGLHNPYTDDLSCPIFKSEFLRPLTNTSLLVFLIESNQAVGMSEDLYKYIPKTLQYMSVRDNALAFGKYLVNLLMHHSLFNLVYYDASQMLKNHLGFLKTPYSNNSFGTHKSVCKSSQNLKKSSGSISHISYSDFKKRCQLMFRQKRVSNSFDTVLNKVKSLQPIELDVIEYINPTEVNSNWLQKYETFLKRPSKGEIEYLDVSDNLPGTVGMAFHLFGDLVHLKFVNVSNYYKGYLILDNTKEGFLNISALRILDLSNNQIEQIKTNAFENLKSLETLYLSNNRISNVEALSLKSMKRLNNRIDTLPKTFRDSLNYVRNFTLNIANNNLKCTCDNIEFVNWLKTTRIYLEDLNAYVCKFGNGSMTTMNRFRYDIFNTECSPPTYSIIILVTSLCLITFVTILCVGLAYRYKWNLRYLYYMTKFKLVGGYQQIRNDETEFAKDVFISYADEDRGFVRQHVVNQLETIGDMSLLVHDRDFEAGQYIGDNIMNAVMSSRRTLVILTQAFIQSKWCMYEMNMARLEGIDTGRNVLCVILKEEIATKHLPLEILDVIRNKTYLEYPQEEEHLEGFWERLKVTLQA